MNVNELFRWATCSSISDKYVKLPEGTSTGGATGETAAASRCLVQELQRETTLVCHLRHQKAFSDPHMAIEDSRLH